MVLQGVLEKAGRRRGRKRNARLVAKAKAKATEAKSYATSRDIEAKTRRRRQAWALLNNAGGTALLRPPGRTGVVRHNSNFLPGQRIRNLDADSSLHGCLCGVMT